MTDASPPPGPAEGSQSRTRRSEPGAATFFVVLMLEALILSVMNSPSRLEPIWYYSDDPGLAMTADALIDQGFRPNVDFGYHYGPLSLGFARAWWGVFGRTPASYQGFSALCSVAVAGGMAGTLAATRSGWAGLALTALSMPRIAAGQYYSFVYGLERLALTLVLWQYARGRLRTALVDRHY